MSTRQLHREVSPTDPESRTASPAKGIHNQEWFRSGDEIVSLRKPDGTVFMGIPAHFSPKAILVTDVANEIEEG